MKAWLNHAKRKRSFEWNGEPVSAPIGDAKFLDQVAGGTYCLVPATLWMQNSPSNRTTIRYSGLDQRPHSYVVTKVLRAVPRVP